MFMFGWGKNKPSARKASPRVRLQLEALEDRLVPTSSPATVVVPPTTTYNVAAGDTADLIADIETANASGLATTINLTQSTYDFTSANNNTMGPNALPAITGNITINGNGAVLMRDPSLGQSTPFRLFYVSGDEVASTSGGQSTGQATGSLTLYNLTLEGGLAEGGSSGTGGGGLGAGGAIFNQGNLTLNGVTVTQNTALGGSSGNGLSTDGGTVTATTATPASAGNFGAGGNGVNSTSSSAGSTSTTGKGGAGGFGGGGGGGTKGGAAGFGAGSGTTKAGGGGLGAGGGIFNMYGTITLINSTLAYNIAQGGGKGATADGGALFNLDGTLNVISSTLADNEAAAGGAVYNLSYGSTTSSPSSSSSSSNSPPTTVGVPSTVTLTNSILADSMGGNDLVNDQNSSTAGAAVVNATEPNIVMTSSTIDSATTNGTPLTGNPELGPLTNNGGLTPTMALLSGSAALGVGGAAPIVPSTDQRGDPRGNVVDLGAYQGTPPETATTTVTLTSSTTTDSSTNTSTTTLTAVITASDGAMAEGTVTFVDTTTGTTLGSATVSVVNGVAQATLTSSALSPGGDNIVATYTSTNQLGGSTGTTIASAGTATQQWLNDLYEMFLGGPIDSAGLTYWSGVLGSSSKTQVAYDIETSSSADDYQINLLFKELLGVSAPSSALSYLQGLMSGGTSLQTVAAIIGGSSEYYTIAGGTNQDWLNAVYEVFLGVSSNDLSTVSSSQSSWLALLNAGETPTQVLMQIMATSEYQTNLVTADYLTYLGREPDSTSLSAFVSQLQSGNTNNAQIIAELIASSEFQTATGT
jgi:hypothetical protein